VEWAERNSCTLAAGAFSRWGANERLSCLYRKRFLTSALTMDSTSTRLNGKVCFVFDHRDPLSLQSVSRRRHISLELSWRSRLFFMSRRIPLHSREVKGRRFHPCYCPVQSWRISLFSTQATAVPMRPGSDLKPCTLTVGTHASRPFGRWAEKAFCSL
jgi:hypothetical protein